jgi:hypothetical protein
MYTNARKHMGSVRCWALRERESFGAEAEDVNPAEAKAEERQRNDRATTEQRQSNDRAMKIPRISGQPTDQKSWVERAAN